MRRHVSVPGLNQHRNKGTRKDKRERRGRKGRSVKTPAVAIGGSLTPSGLCDPSQVREGENKGERGRRREGYQRVVGWLLDGRNGAYGVAGSK